MEKAQKIFRQMFDNDPFTQWLGIECLFIAEGQCKLRMQIRKEMLNGFGIAHGGISYSLADSALAFASNAMGRACVSVDTGISHTHAIKEGDELTAEAKLLETTNKFAFFDVTVRNGSGVLVALFKGTVYQKEKVWEV